MYTLIESAIAHAKAAEKLVEPDGKFLNEQKSTIPVFVNLLLQSIELTLKAFAVEAGLFQPSELRKKKFKNGHGVNELALAINERISPNDVVNLLLPTASDTISNTIVKKMIYSVEFEPTRESYAKRKITYNEFAQGELQVINGSRDWYKAVLEASLNISSAVIAHKNG